MSEVMCNFVSLNILFLEYLKVMCNIVRLFNLITSCVKGKESYVGKVISNVVRFERQ